MSNQKIIQEYKAHLQSIGRAAETIRRYMGILKQLEVSTQGQIQLLRPEEIRSFMQQVNHRQPLRA